MRIIALSNYECFIFRFDFKLFLFKSTFDLQEIYHFSLTALLNNNSMRVDVLETTFLCQIIILHDRAVLNQHKSYQLKITIDLWICSSRRLMK